MIKEKLYSIINNRCPRCHQGKVWPYGPYENVLSNSGKIYESCSHCGLKYYREIGFWYGAMYVAYALGIAVFLILWAVTAIVLPDDWNTWVQVGIICAGILMLAPVNYYISRLLWLNLFVHYEQIWAVMESLDVKPKMVNQT